MIVTVESRGNLIRFFKKCFYLSLHHNPDAMKDEVKPTIYTTLRNIYFFDSSWYFACLVNAVMLILL